MIQLSRLQLIQRATTNRQRGAAMVETAFVVTILLAVIFGMLDLGLAVLHHNHLSEAARRLAREAIVRGEMAAPEKEVWGPESMTGTADADSESASILREVLIAVEPSSVEYIVDWPDGDNEPNDHVRVVLNCAYDPIVPFILGDVTIELEATSTMRIAH